MSIKKAIKTQIESLASLTVYYGHAPQGTAYPYAVMNRIGDSRYGMNQGGSEGWYQENFQLDLYHDDDDALEVIRNAVIDGLHGQGPVTWSDETVHVCLITDSRDLSELENEGGNVAVVRHTLEAMVKYN